MSVSLEEPIFILGLDSAPPRLLFEDLKGELPNIESVMDYKQPIRSTHPPITIPAWISMSTGKTPGELGLYGFRHRRIGSYDDLYIANSKLVNAKTVWASIGQRGGSSVVVGVPPSYPPKPVKGVLISDFITPDPSKPYTWPRNLRFEIEKLLGGPYIFDVEFRSHNKDKIRDGLWRMTEAQFKVVKHLAKTRKWSLFFYVLIGTDRVQHAFWKYYDPGHPKHPEKSKYETVIPDYYKLVDRLFGDLLTVLPRDTRFIVVSDHGAKPMHGAFAINEWLIDEGFLVLRKYPEKPGTDLAPGMVDWSKTTAWGWGGYYARIFLNVKGREPLGAIDKEEVPGVIEELKRKLSKIRGPNGESWNTKVYTPSELYPSVKGDPPDLIVYFDDLYWRSAGTIGWKTPYLEENDRGPDDAVHDWYGILGSTVKPMEKPDTITELFTKGYGLL